MEYGTRVNLSLSKPWRPAASSAMNFRQGGVLMFTAMPQAITPEAISSFFALAWGFAAAGFCASGYRLFAKHFPSFRQLEVGPVAARFAAIPLLMFSAPYIIMRNTLRGRKLESRRADLVMVATVIAGLWSLMSGTVVVLALQALLHV
jgi:hypothetical protein